jgi:hypothetical protein
MAGQQLDRRALTGGACPPAVGTGARGAAVATRDTTTHGEWVANVTAIIRALAYIRQLQEEMLGGLTAANASRSQISAVQAWSANLDARRKYIYDWLNTIDGRLKPLIDAIDAAGGVEEVADAGYHADY